MSSSKIEKKVESIKQQLMEIKEMRPGSLSKQYNVCGMPGCKCKVPWKPQKHGPYYNLSYTVRGKGGTKFIRKEFAKKVTQETTEYKKFKKLTEMWISLAIELSNLKIEEEKTKINSKK